VALEFQILTGARAGQKQVFDKSVVTIGRHPLSDLRFDAEADLDVSSVHAEIRGVDGAYTLRDAKSTNGTFLNGKRLTTERGLTDGDRISFGESGPQVQVTVLPDLPAPTRVRASGARDHQTGETPLRARSTGERVAIAVAEQTSKMRSFLAAVMLVAAVGIAVAYWLGHDESAAQVKELQKLLAQNESASAAMSAKMQSGGRDTAFANGLQRRERALRTLLADAPTGPAGAMDSVKVLAEAQRAIVSMDVPGINDRNAPAVAYLVTELDGKPYAATAFAVTTSGLLVTNAHNVKSTNGTPATKVAVKFRDSSRFLHAHVVKVSDDPGVDLAILQVDEGGPFHTVTAVAADGGDAREGSPVVSIGFVFATALPMEGTGDDFVAKTSLHAGTVSKRLSNVLQLDAFAGHGSSGSPVFDSHGSVVGVIWGGPKEAEGRIAYAVPSQKLAVFLPIQAQAILK
jgi:pSer/pThr/pTyr-binding forkhead associated (FHA) protein/V8-like Glu-specific endopeptidase